MTISRTLLAAFAVPLLALTVSCGSSDTEPASNTEPSAGTDALAGSDQESLDQYTTDQTTPLDEIDTSELDLITDGTLRVGTLSDAPPNIFLEDGVFTGYDNELLRAIGDKLDLDVEFASTDFSALLAQVQNQQFDVGSSSISTTAERRENVGFTNGYDFGYMAVVAKEDSAVTGFDSLSEDTRVGVVQGTVQDDYVTNTLGLEPVRFPDYTTVFANVKNGQIDAWVAPSQQATGQVEEGDGTTIAETIINTENFTAYAVNSDNQPLIDALNAGLDAVIADGTWTELTEEWYPEREQPTDWEPGSRAVDVKR